MEADFAVSGRGSYAFVYGRRGASSQEVPLDAIEGYLLAAEVMPTAIHVRIYSNTVFVFFCILWCFN